MRRGWEHGHTVEAAMNLPRHAGMTSVISPDSILLHLNLRFCCISPPSAIGRFIMARHTSCAKGQPLAPQSVRTWSVSSVSLNVHLYAVLVVCTKNTTGTILREIEGNRADILMKDQLQQVGE